MIQYIYDIAPTSNSANAAMWQDYISILSYKNCILYLPLYLIYTIIHIYIILVNMPTAKNDKVTIEHLLSMSKLG